MLRVSLLLLRTALLLRVVLLLRVSLLLRIAPLLLVLRILLPLLVLRILLLLVLRISLLLVLRISLLLLMLRIALLLRVLRVAFLLLRVALLLPVLRVALRVLLMLRVALRVLLARSLAAVVLACVRIPLHVGMRTTVFAPPGAGRVGVRLCVPARSDGRAICAVSATLCTRLAMRMRARTSAGLCASAADTGSAAPLSSGATPLMHSLRPPHAGSGEKHGAAKQ